jgi:hypothetical protein
MAVISPSLPYGAEAIIASRLRGRAPAMVMLSLLPARYRFNAGPFSFVRAIPGRSYDWRFLRKIETMVVTDVMPEPGFLEGLCKQAFPVRIWVLGSDVGATVIYLPTLESVSREDGSRWDWRLSFESMLPFQNRDWGSWFATAVEDMAHG